MTQSPVPYNNDRPVPPGLAEFLARRMRDISAQINCHTVGTIQSFDTVTQTATVAINLQKVVKGVNPLNNIAEASNQVYSYPILVSVPVIFLQGGGAFITFPIAAGDTCLLFFCDRDISIWTNTGQVAPPNSDRVHSINDAVALVGLRGLSNPLANYNTTELVIGFPTGLVSVQDRTAERLAQSGDLKATARSTAPSGWLLAYGQSISKTTYPDLFAAIGYTYGGSGDNFNVPDLRGRTPVGIDNMGGSDANVLTSTYTPNRNTLGGTIGEETHTLTIPEIPAHHHTYSKITAAANGDPGSGQTQTFGSANTGDTGGGLPHYNVQPGLMVNWVIKI